MPLPISAPSTTLDRTRSRSKRLGESSIQDLGDGSPRPVCGRGAVLYRLGFKGEDAYCYKFDLLLSAKSMHLT
jgi:hypothetical protein